VAVAAAIGASSYLNLDQGDLEQDTATQVKKPDWRNSLSTSLGRPPVSPDFAVCQLPVSRRHRRARHRGKLA
jgi:hypothetical protein